MTAAARTFGWILGAVLAASAPSRGFAHPGGGKPPAVDEHVAHIVETADEACLVRGLDTQELSGWARSRHWTPATSEQLTAGANDFATLVAGWTHQTRFAAFAVVQSRLNAPLDGYICSVTTRLVSAEQHGEVRSAFQAKFGATAKSVPERDESHADKFWIERGLGPPIKVTILHAPATRSITIRMIHGKARPPRP